MVRFPWTLAVENSGDPQRNKLELRRGRTDHTALRSSALLLSVTGSCCMFHAQFIWRLQRTHWSHAWEGKAEHINRENEFDLLHISLEVKKGKKIEWFWRDSQPTVLQDTNPQRPREESSIGWLLLQQVFDTQRKQICMIYSVSSTSSSYKSCSEDVLLCQANCGCSPCD